MAVPRPVLLALLGFALIVSALLATRGVGGSETVTAPTNPATKAQPAPAPAQPATPKAHKAVPATASKHPVAPRHAAKPKPAVAKSVAKTPAITKLPPGVSPTILPVVRALGQNQVVVLFFSQKDSADDSATSAAVNGVKGMKGVAVFNAGIDQLAMYRPILANVGVSQVPAVVVVRPGHQAQLLEGFIDKSSLRQAVADALQ
jgi:hypothetical protein